MNKGDGKNFKVILNSHKVDCDVGSFSNNFVCSWTKKKANRKENKIKWRNSEKERDKDRDEVVHH